MESDKIIQVINEVGADVFGRSEIKFKPSDSSSDVRGWDSLTQVILIAEIERRFDIKFSFKDIASISTIGDLVNLIKTKNSNSK